MKELIKITERNGVDVVSARELHQFLEVGTRFDNWIKRMLEYEFTDGVDYVKIDCPNLDADFQWDYALSLDCSKEISMIQRTKKGKQARQYFIAFEKIANDVINNQLKTATDSAKRRLYINNRIKEIDSNIFHEMKERKGLIKERNRIDQNDFQQLSLAIFEIDYNKLPSAFPAKSKMLKIS